MARSKTAEVVVAMPEKLAKIADGLVSQQTRDLEARIKSLPIGNIALVRVMKKTLETICRKEFSGDSAQKTPMDMLRETPAADAAHETPATILVFVMGWALRGQESFKSDYNAFIEAAQIGIALAKDNSKNKIFKDNIRDATNLFLMSPEAAIDAVHSFLYRMWLGEQLTAALGQQYENAWSMLLKTHLRIADSMAIVAQFEASEAPKAQPEAPAGILLGMLDYRDALKRAINSRDLKELDKLSWHQHPRVREEVIMNQYTNQISVRRCVHDKDRSVQKRAVEYLDESKESKEMLADISNGTDIEMIIIAASNPALPALRLNSLENHPEERVRIVAKAAIKKRESIRKAGSVSWKTKKSGSRQAADSGLIIL